MKSKVSVKQIRHRNVGGYQEKVYTVHRTDGNLTINDAVNIRKRIRDQAEAQGYTISDFTTRVQAGNWMTFKDEESYENYFSNKVRDPSKFYSFTNVHYYVTFY